MRATFVAFVGAGCVGKTTLFEAFRRHYAGDGRVAFAAEAAKRYFAGHPMAEELRFTAPVQGEIQARAMANELEASRRGRLVVADRSVLCAPVYVSAIGDAAGAAGLLARARPWARRYSVIYLFDPAGVAFEKTAERREEEDTRRVLHEEYLRYLTANDIPFTLLTGGVEERFTTVDATLRTFLN